MFPTISPQQMAFIHMSSSCMLMSWYLLTSSAAVDGALVGGWHVMWTMCSLQRDITCIHVHEDRAKGNFINLNKNTNCRRKSERRSRKSVQYRFSSRLSMTYNVLSAAECKVSLLFNLIIMRSYHFTLDHLLHSYVFPYIQYLSTCVFVMLLSVCVCVCVWGYTLPFRPLSFK